MGDTGRDVNFRLGWVRAAAAVVLAVGLVVVAFAALTGLLLALAVVIGLLVLNLVYLPRAALRLRIGTGWLALLLLPVLLLLGLAVNGVPGIGWSAALWLVAVGLPRVIGRDLFRRARRKLGARVYVETTGRITRAGGRSATESVGRPAARPMPRAGGPGRDGFGL
jgi:hypothetical protein